VAEWSIAPHSKCGIRATVSGVRIPPSPPGGRDKALYLLPFLTAEPPVTPHYIPYFRKDNLGGPFSSQSSFTRANTLIRQRHLMPSCGGRVPTAERTLDPARMLRKSLNPGPEFENSQDPNADIGLEPAIGVAVLFHLDARLLEDRPPSLDLGLVEGAERLRRLLLARRDLHAKVRET
jgi:hypothetical protein